MASYKVVGPDPNGKGHRVKLTIELGYNERGIRIRKYKTVTLSTLSERVIQKAIRQFEVELATNRGEEQRIDYGHLSFKKAVELWLKNHVSSLAPNSQKAYTENIQEALTYFGPLKIDQMKRIHFVEFKNHLLDNNIKVARGKLDAAKAVITKMLEWDVISHDPGKNVTIPKSKEKMNFYTREEVQALFEALEKESHKYRVLIKLAVLSGMRKGEIEGLTFENVDFKTNTIIVKHNLNFTKERGFFLGPTKNKKERRIVMPEDFMKELRAYVDEVQANKLAFGDRWRGIEGLDIIFGTADGRPTEDSVVSKVFRNILKRHNLRPIRFHDLRHTHASLLLTLGEKMKVVQERLGHSSITLTMDTYSHLTQEDEKSAADLLSRLL